MATQFEVNGRKVSVNVQPRMTLADCLRHELKLTGTHVACEHGVCGACTVIMDGEAVRSCLTLAVQAENSKIVTVEGLSPAEGLSPLQQAFKHHHSLQCGFCTVYCVRFACSRYAECAECDDAQRADVVEKAPCIHGFQHSCVHLIRKP
jgi:carbon-monoxide dehydrogenase small subunit